MGYTWIKTKDGKSVNTKRLAMIHKYHVRLAGDDEYYRIEGDLGNGLIGQSTIVLGDFKEEAQADDYLKKLDDWIGAREL